MEADATARQAIMALMRAADGARRAMTRALEPFDLTLPQFNVLTILRVNDELPTFHVAAHMVEATPGITRLMNTLATKGHIRRRQSPDDRREQLCSLTPQGRRVVDAAIPPFTAAQQALISELEVIETLQLTALLRRVPPERGRRAGPAAADRMRPGNLRRAVHRSPADPVGRPERR